jgi:hypothetical protein
MGICIVLCLFALLPGCQPGDTYAEEAFDNAPPLVVPADVTPIPLSVDALPEATETAAAFSLTEGLKLPGPVTAIELYRREEVILLTEPEDLARWTALLQAASIRDATVNTYAAETQPPPGSYFEIYVESGGGRFGLSVVSYLDPAQIRYRDQTGRLVTVRGDPSQGFQALCGTAEAETAKN